MRLGARPAARDADAGHECLRIGYPHSIPALSGDTTNEARTITPDGRWVVGLSGSRGFLHAVNTPNVFNVVSSDGAQSTLLTGAGYRTNSGQQQLIISGWPAVWFTAWMTADGGTNCGAAVRGASGKSQHSCGEWAGGDLIQCFLRRVDGRRPLDK